LDHLRKEKVRKRIYSPDEGEDALAQIPAHGPTPEQSASAQQQVGLPVDALAGLSERRRQILVLHRFHHWTYGRVVRELDRYHPGAIFIARPALGQVRVTGSYKLGDSSAVLRALAEITGARVLSAAPYLTVLH
jgi:ferric-dicitrate binding protein FerR (iron transport regulator)